MTGSRAHDEALDTTAPVGRLIIHVFAALAEFIRALIVADTHEGLAAARARRPYGRGPHRRQRGPHPRGPRHAARPGQQRHRHRQDPRRLRRHAF
ncbi:recombinase family protein [Streptomyces sp. AM2-3-1]|uniref:recombinase family protein n=1 Tax=Streptomyces sp. AM2-3-1 TaxID=3075824 RepID=UPI0028C47E1F|nr:recombinase family protein [Streptomyces sp. AM2-3-1]WNO70060.1 recombinase family protein [Streptomyces sp. AM2-3-1]